MSADDTQRNGGRGGRRYIKIDTERQTLPHPLRVTVRAERTRLRPEPKGEGPT
jgi:hypothetical protein